ncbi:hypothetical protein GCM10023178_75940 [Actinomadura luteofluorescens]
MRDVLGDIAGWYGSGRTFALATVVNTFRSAPRPPGAAMAVSPDGEVAGSVSGGCVEVAVYELGQTVLETGEPVVQRYGVSDDDAFAVGLTCGGILDVLVEPVGPGTFPELRPGRGRREAGDDRLVPAAGAARRPHQDRA